MTTVKVLGRVVFALQEIRSEPSMALRRHMFKTYVGDIEDPDEKYVLNLILSFQLSEFVRVGRSKFNSLPVPKNIDEAIARWMNKQDRRQYIKLPKLLQTTIEFMTLPKSLHLTKTDIAETITDYVDPYKWIAENAPPPKPGTKFCHFCGLSVVVKHNLCEACEYGLSSFTEARHQDFLVELNSKNCYWSVIPAKIKRINYCKYGFRIQYEEDNMFSFEVQKGNRTQLGFDFEEYQKASE